MARVFLHIGAPKTGTTFLQQVLWRHRGLVADQGLTLPLGSVKDHFYAALDLRHAAAPAPDGTDASGAWDRLVAAAGRAEGDVLVSHELFCLVGDDDARRAVAAFADQGREVHVVLTARDIGRQLTAHWQETVKIRGSLGFAGFMAQAGDPESSVGRYLRNVEDYGAQVRRWAGDLPSEQVHVVTVPPPGAARDLLWQRFAGLLGLTAERFDLAVRANQSLGVEQVELLRRVNLALGEDRLTRPGPYPQIVKGLYAHQILTQRPGRSLTLAGADLAFAQEWATRGVADLRRLGVDVVGDLDELLVADADPAGISSAREPVPAGVLLEEALEATIALLEEVPARRRRQQEKVAALQERLRELETAESATSRIGRLWDRLRRLR